MSDEKMNQNTGRDEAMDPADETGSAEGSFAEEAGEDAPVDELSQLQGERDDLYARLARVSADYQNYMKRMEVKVGESVMFAKGDLLRGFIPVLDQLDVALKNEPTGDEGRSLFSGLRIVRDELVKVLEGAGVRRIEPKVGEVFDPHLHEAMMQMPAEGVEAGHVAASLGPGYVFGERTLRAAQVAVVPGG